MLARYTTHPLSKYREGGSAAAITGDEKQTLPGREGSVELFGSAPRHLERARGLHVTCLQFYIPAYGLACQRSASCKHERLFTKFVTADGLAEPCWAVPSRALQDMTGSQQQGRAGGLPGRPSRQPSRLAASPLWDDTRHDMRSARPSHDEVPCSLHSAAPRIISLEINPSRLSELE